MGIFELLILLNEGGQAFFIPDTAGESLKLHHRPLTVFQTLRFANRYILNTVKL